MSTRAETLAQLAYLVRSNHTAALWVIAFLSADASQEILQSAVEGAEAWATQPELLAGNHYAAFRERYGVLPGK